MSEYEEIVAIQNAAKAMKPSIELTYEQAREFLFNLLKKGLAIFDLGNAGEDDVFIVVKRYENESFRGFTACRES
jgi:hypothetical protein